MSRDEESIANLLAVYETALNTSDTDLAVKLYAEDGVFMPQHSPSSVGIAAVRRAYDAVFKTIELKVKFTILEMRQVAPEWAFARTNSAGIVKIKASGFSGPEANQELFIFQKFNGTWKIARYCFSTTNPPRT